MEDLKETLKTEKTSTLNKNGECSIDDFRKDKMKKIAPQLMVCGFILGLITYEGFTLIGVSA